MTVTTIAGMTGAMQGLHVALDGPRLPGAPLGAWRWTVRQRMAAVRDALVAATGGPEEGWLAARNGTLLRERTSLLGRLSVLGPLVLESPDVEGVRADLLRLLADISHHVQRVHDLAYDDVELELGGSE